MNDSRYTQDIERLLRCFPSDIRKSLNNIKGERENAPFTKKHGLTWFINNYWSVMQKVMEFGPSAKELAILLWYLGWRSKSDDPCGAGTIRRALDRKRKALNAAAGCGDDRSGPDRQAFDETMATATIPQTPIETGTGECGEARHSAVISGETRNDAAKCGDERPGSEQQAFDKTAPTATIPQTPIEAGAADCGGARHPAAIRGDARHPAANCGEQPNLPRGAFRTSPDEGAAMRNAPEPDAMTGDATRYEGKHSSQTVRDTWCEEETTPYLLRPEEVSQIPKPRIDPDSLPALVEVTASKGGVGKSFVADRVRDFCKYIDIPAVVVRICSGSSLPKPQPGSEIYLRAEDLFDSLWQQNADASPFLSLMNTIEVACEDRGVVIIDWGPDLQDLRRCFLREDRLGKILSRSKRSAISMIVATAEANVIRQAADILRDNCGYTKYIRNILVYNYIAGECDLGALTPASRTTYETELAPLAANAIRFDCPALDVQHRPLFQSCMLPMTTAIKIEKMLIAKHLKVSIEEAGYFQTALRKYWSKVELKLADIMGVDRDIYFSVMIS